MGESPAEEADCAKEGKNAVATPAAPNCRNNSLRRMRIVPFFLFVQQLSSGTKDFTFAQGASEGNTPCTRKILRDEVYCTTSVSGIEWTKLPYVPVIVRL